MAIIITSFYTGMVLGPALGGILNRISKDFVIN